MDINFFSAWLKVGVEYQGEIVAAYFTDNCETVTFPLWEALTESEQQDILTRIQARFLHSKLVR